MPTIDLTSPPPAPAGTLEGLPRRLALTLPELRLLAGYAADAPLPFEVDDRVSDDSAMESRLGGSRSTLDDQALARTLDGLHDPHESLTRRGLLTDEGADAGVVGALGLLATPRTAVDLDVSVDGIRARAWHRQRGDAVATLATADGVVFELAWFEAAHWAEELARAGVLPEDAKVAHLTGTSGVPAVVDLPYELLDAGAEAVRSGRADLLATVVAHHTGASRDADGRALDDAGVTSLVGALVSGTRGRLRALAADIEAGGTLVGVVSWVLLADGWRALVPHDEDGTARVEVRRVEPADLAGLLGPVVAEFSEGGQ